MLASVEDRGFDKDCELDWYCLEDGAKNANRSVLDQNRLNFPPKAIKQAIFIVNPLSCTCNPVRSLRIGPRNGQRQISASGPCAKYDVIGHVTDFADTRFENVQPRSWRRFATTLIPTRRFGGEALRPEALSFSKPIIFDVIFAR